MNPDDPLVRHSRAGGNPDDNKISREAGQHCGFVPLRGLLYARDGVPLAGCKSLSEFVTTP